MLVSMNLENDLYDKSSSQKISSGTLHNIQSNKAEETRSMDGPVVYLQYTALPIMRRAQQSYGKFYIMHTRYQ